MTARWFLLAVLTTSYGVGAFGMPGISPLSPSLVEGFGLTRLQIAFIVPSICVGGLFFSLPGRRLADRLGVRTSFLGGLGLGAAGHEAGAWSPSFPTFLLSRSWPASGGASSTPPSGAPSWTSSRPASAASRWAPSRWAYAEGLRCRAVLPAIAAALGWRAAIITCASWWRCR